MDRGSKMFAHLWSFHCSGSAAQDSPHLLPLLLPPPLNDIILEITLLLLPLPPCLKGTRGPLPKLGGGWQPTSLSTTALRNYLDIHFFSKAIILISSNPPQKWHEGCKAVILGCYWPTFIHSPDSTESSQSCKFRVKIEPIYVVCSNAMSKLTLIIEKSIYTDVKVISSFSLKIKSISSILNFLNKKNLFCYKKTKQNQESLVGWNRDP